MQHFRAPFVIIAHRGASAEAPENTLRAFELALSSGADAVELDVHRVEHRLVVMHDERLERTTNGIGALCDLSLADLSSIRVVDKESPAVVRSLPADERGVTVPNPSVEPAPPGADSSRSGAEAGDPIPFLEDVFDLVGDRAGINVELKGVGTGLALASLDVTFPRSLIVSSFSHSELATFHERRPDVATAPLASRDVDGLMKQAADVGAFSVHLKMRLAMTDNRISETVGAAKRQDLRVFVYPVNDAHTVKRLSEAGVDGVFTNDPRRMRDALR